MLRAVRERVTVIRTASERGLGDTPAAGAFPGAGPAAAAAPPRARTAVASRSLSYPAGAAHAGGTAPAAAEPSAPELRVLSDLDPRVSVSRKGPVWV